MAGRPEEPIDPDAGPVARLAFELRELRRRAGSPTYRKMAQQANYSGPTLSVAVSGKSLPTLAVTLAYVKACGGDVEEWRTRWQETAAQLAKPAEPAGPTEPAEPAESTHSAEPEQQDGAGAWDARGEGPAPVRDRRLLPVRLRVVALGGVLTGMLAILVLPSYLYEPGSGGQALPRPTSTITTTAWPQPGTQPPSPAPTSTPALQPVANTTHTPAPTSSPSSTTGASTGTLRANSTSNGVRYGFENGTQGWGGFYGDPSITTTSAVAYEGSRSLQVSAQPGYSAVGVSHPPGVQGGTTVTYQVWSDGQHSGSLIPFAQSSDYTNHMVPEAAVSLPAHGWTRITWTVPQISVLAIGLQIHSDGGGLVVALDAVTW